MKRSYLFLAQGFEEIEALSTVDILRRAGMDVTTISIYGDPYVSGAHGITIKADGQFDKTDFSDAEWLIIPGGMPGSTNLHEFSPLSDLLKKHAASGKIAAICAAPAVVLAPLGILDGKKATCYPGFGNQCDSNGAEVHDVPVMVSGNIITANGPASAMKFALAIVAESCGKEKAQEVGCGLLCYQKSENFYF